MENKKAVEPNLDKASRNSDRNKKFKATFLDLLDEKSREKLERMKTSLPATKKDDNGSS